MLNDNQCFISGRLGRDPELKYTQSGKAYCRLSVACFYKVKEEERTDWVPVQVWGPLAENCGSNLQKGQPQDRGNFSRYGQPTPPPIEQPGFSDYANQPQKNTSGVMHGQNKKDEDIPF